MAPTSLPLSCHLRQKPERGGQVPSVPIWPEIVDLQRPESGHEQKSVTDTDTSPGH